MSVAALASLLMFQAAPAISAETEACLRDNAAEVERATDTLTEAADFLISYLCGTTVSSDANAIRHAAHAEAMANWRASVQTPPEGEPAEYGELFSGSFLDLSVNGFHSPYAIPMPIREIAARHVLDARLARLEQEGAE